ncbi:procathepsin L-like [Hemicordylus capensis]|uniref:procathepsin L-like n=1 Tax=Hemicordylus capensis TaxID=884348 RepID=UPI00230432B4|nr:procathepsin L-like [Hemicordylus capensis]
MLPTLAVMMLTWLVFPKTLALEGDWEEDSAEEYLDQEVNARQGLGVSYIRYPELKAAHAPEYLDLVLEEAWKGWKEAYAKEYLEEEEAFRRAVWKKNLQKIQDHNHEASLGKHTYQLGMNHLGDLTDEEFNQMLNGFHPSPRSRNVDFFEESTVLETPREVDWRVKGYVTPVKNQGHCGSCWAFSATGALEGLHFKKTGKLVSLSEQNLIDCSRKLGNHGCKGGYITRAFEYVQDNKGINSELVYPYLGKDGSSCHFDPLQRAADCTSLVMVQEGSEVALEQAVATVGPVSVAVDARSSEFHFYKSGILASRSCSHWVNHAMLAVGYGTSQDNGKNMDYWILKNSWSEDWGEEGYMRLVKGADNHCGVARQATYPTL